MKIWADKIPKEHKRYLTEGKKYEVITSYPANETTGRGFDIINDNGELLFCIEFQSSHIIGNWNVEE